MWRVLLDTNVFISFLLSPYSSTPPAVIVRAAIAGEFRLCVSWRLLVNLAARVQAKPYLAERIAQTEIDRLLAVVRDIAEILDDPNFPLPVVVRDRKDDYLIAHAVAAAPDFLESGDNDLASLGAIGKTVIVRPIDFVRHLQESRGRA